MFNFPFFRFPYSRYYYSYYNNYIQNSNQTACKKKSENIEEKKEVVINTPKKENTDQKRSSKYNSFGPVNFINPFAENIKEDKPVLEILGLKLYLDDLIILGLLFLLYKEKVQDETLFLALILLLLT